MLFCVTGVTTGGVVGQKEVKSAEPTVQVEPSHFNVLMHELAEHESVVQLLLSLQFLNNPELAPSESNQRTEPPEQAVR